MGMNDQDGTTGTFDRAVSDVLAEIEQARATEDYRAKALPLAVTTVRNASSGFTARAATQFRQHVLGRWQAAGWQPVEGSGRETPIPR